MTDTDKDLAELDMFFDAARRETETLPVGLADRIIADAALVQQEWQAPVSGARSGPLRQLYEMLGGWPAIGGLATACAAGVWLGFAPPSSLLDPAQFVGTESALFEDDSLVDAMSEEG